MDLLVTVRHKAALKSAQADNQAIKRQASKEAPSVYKCGDKVLVKYERKKGKIKAKGVGVVSSYQGEIVDCKVDTNRYKVKADVDGKEVVEWMCVSRLSSLTRAEEKARDKNVQGIIIKV